MEKTVEEILNDYKDNHKLELENLKILKQRIDFLSFFIKAIEVDNKEIEDVFSEEEKKENEESIKEVKKTIIRMKAIYFRRHGFLQEIF